jgi:hypothetical protein
MVFRIETFHFGPFLEKRKRWKRGATLGSCRSPVVNGQITKKLPSQ